MREARGRWDLHLTREINRFKGRKDSRVTEKAPDFIASDVARAKKRRSEEAKKEL